jgi:uncharacterized membrane protein
MTTSGSDHPVRFEADYPEAPSRPLALLGVLFFIKGLLLIPHIIVLYVLSIVAFVVAYIGYWAVLITGKYPEGMFNFVYGVQRWGARVESWLYGWSDSYPPFSLDAGDYPARLEIDTPEAPSRLLALFGVLLVFIKMILLIPHIVILGVLGIVAIVVAYIGYWVVLITGRYPQGLFNLITGVQRWEYRTTSWLLGLTDQYPPFSLS